MLPELGVTSSPLKQYWGWILAFCLIFSKGSTFNAIKSIKMGGFRNKKMKE